jgi:hypothetical protein
VAGVPTRGEMTDAVMVARVECVMLNDGIGEADIVTRNDFHG